MQNRSLQTEKALRYKKQFDIPEYDISIITASKTLADLFEKTEAVCHNPKESQPTGSWCETMRLLKEKEMEPEDIHFSPEHLAQLIELAEAGTINSTVAKEVFEKVFEEDIDPKQYVEEKGLRYGK